MKLSGVQMRTRVVDFVTDEVGDWSEWRDTYADDVFTWESSQWQVQTRVNPEFVQAAVRKTKAELKAVMRAELKNVSDRLYEI